MINIASILNYVKTHVEARDARFEWVDDEHVLDTKTGVQFHLHDDYFRITYGDEIVAETHHFTEDEKGTLWEMKEIITDPETSRIREQNYQANLSKGRYRLAELYENPVPPQNRAPLVETDTDEYAG